MPNEMLDAALAYAARGWPVFPCHTWRGDRCSCGKADCPSPAKHPYTKAGFKDASTDETIVRGWWAKWPDANIGLPTGVAFDVLDIDGMEGLDAMSDAIKRWGDAGEAPAATTGGGGLHWLYTPTGVGNRARMIDHVDWRGAGGYIIAPPSLHRSGERYRWATGYGPDDIALQAPQGAVKELLWPAAVAAPRSARPSGATKTGAYGQRALEGELAELLGTGEGSRNNQLNIAAFNLYQLVATGELDDGEVTDRLRAAARGIGLVESEINQTLTSAHAAGLASPREAPNLTLVEGSAVRAVRPEAAVVAKLNGAAPSAPVLGLRWVPDVLAIPPVEPPVLIDGLMRRGELVVLGAPRGIGKSWLGMNLAVLLSSGTGLLAGELAIRRPGRVLFCQGELGEWESWRRWKMLGAGYELSGIAESFDRWRVRTTRRRVSFTAEGSQHSDEYVDAVLDGRIEESIAAHGFDLLIIDPWAVYFAGAENSNDEVEAALDKLRDLALRYGIAILILHHLGKSTEAREPEDLWRGASRLADWASTRVTLLQHYTDTEAKQQGMTRQQARRYVDVKFLRRGEPTDDFSAVLDPTSGWWNRWRAPEEAAEERRVHIEPTDVAAACAASGGYWPSIVEAALALDVAQGTARTLLAAAVRKGLLEEVAGRNGGRGHRLPQPGLGGPGS